MSRVTYICAEEYGRLQERPCSEVASLFFNREITWAHFSKVTDIVHARLTISDLHHIHIIVSIKSDRVQMLDIYGQNRGDIGPEAWVTQAVPVLSIESQTMLELHLLTYAMSVPVQKSKLRN